MNDVMIDELGYSIILKNFFEFINNQKDAFVYKNIRDNEIIAQFITNTSIQNISNELSKCNINHYIHPNYVFHNYTSSNPWIASSNPPENYFFELRLNQNNSFDNYLIKNKISKFINDSAVQEVYENIKDAHAFWVHITDMKFAMLCKDIEKRIKNKEFFNRKDSALQKKIYKEIKIIRKSRGVNRFVKFEKIAEKQNEIFNKYFYNNISFCIMGDLINSCLHCFIPDINWAFSCYIEEYYKLVKSNYR